MIWKGQRSFLNLCFCNPGKTERYRTWLKHVCQYFWFILSCIFLKELNKWIQTNKFRVTLQFITKYLLTFFHLLAQDTFFQLIITIWDIFLDTFFQWFYTENIFWRFLPKPKRCSDHACEREREFWYSLIGQ